MQGVLLLVFSKFCHLPFLRGVQTQSTRTGLGGYWVRATHYRVLLWNQLRFMMLQKLKWAHVTGGSKGRCSVCVLPPASRCMHACVHMSVCDLPVHVDVSITPGCCWCSLLLFEVSAAAADCLAFWCCECWGKKTTRPCSRAQIWLIYADVCLILNLVCIRGPFDAACFALSCHFKGNKGGVSARMTMFGHPVCFLNCHLPAHMRNLEQRMEDFESILQQQQFEGGAATGVLDHEWVTFLFFLFLFFNKRSN